MMGEETIFLSDLKKKKQNIIIVPKVIAIHSAVSTDDKLNVQHRYYIQGAFFTRVSKNNYLNWIFLKLFFDLKQNRIKIVQVFAALKSARKGKEDYQQITK